MPFRTLFEALHEKLGALDRGDDILGVGQQSRALVRQGHAPVCPYEEFCFELLLKNAYLPAHRRL